ncbi:MAG: hypothetical protein ACRCY8_07935 [Dermatophilaceae bacterium]
MSPSATPGQHLVVQQHYQRNGEGPVAFVDETYSAQPGHANFYVMSAVVVRAKERDGLREDLDNLVEEGYWHTSEALRTADGQDRTLRLLGCLDETYEACVIIHKTTVHTGDTDGESARQECLGRLLEALFRADSGTHDPVRLVVMEERRERRQNNNDRRTRAQLISSGRIDGTLRLLSVSPGADHLLWLPDLVCSAYRQKLLGRSSELLAQVELLTTVVTLS